MKEAPTGQLSGHRAHAIPKVQLHTPVDSSLASPLGVISARTQPGRLGQVPGGPCTSRDPPACVDTGRERF